MVECLTIGMLGQRRFARAVRPEFLLIVPSGGTWWMKTNC